MTADLLNDLDRQATAAETAAWWVWLIGQAAIVAGFAGRVKLSSGYPEPVEASADVALAVGQVILASLLGATLLGRRAAAVRALASAGVFAVLAGLLAGRGVGIGLHLNAVTAVWLLAIGRIARLPGGRVIATFLTIALPTTAYARLEFGPTGAGLGFASTFASPPMGIAATVIHPADFSPAVVPIAILLASFGSEIVSKRLRRLRPLQLP